MPEIPPIKPTIQKIYILAGLGCLIFAIVSFIGFSLYRVANLSGLAADSTLAAQPNLPESPDPLISKVVYDEDLITKPILNGADPEINQSPADATIVIYSDFECGACRENGLAIQEMLKKSSKKLRVVWKDYPDNHPDSFSWQAAMAGRCADMQGRFFDYRDRVFEIESQSKQALENLARDMNFDMAAFKDCLADQKIEKLILDNIFEANALQITGVPSVFINGKEFIGPMNVAELEDAISQLSQNGNENPTTP